MDEETRCMYVGSVCLALVELSGKDMRVRRERFTQHTEEVREVAPKLWKLGNRETTIYITEYEHFVLSTEPVCHTQNTHTHTRKTQTKAITHQ
jgi:hypothetical protein